MRKDSADGDTTTEPKKAGGFKMKKTYVLVLAAVLMLSLLTGCRRMNPMDTTVPSTAAPTTAPTTLPTTAPTTAPTTEPFPEDILPGTEDTVDPSSGANVDPVDPTVGTTQDPARNRRTPKY